MKKKMVATVLLFGLCLSICGCGDNVKKSVEEAQAAYSSGNYQEVIDLLETHKDDESAKDLYRSAEIELLIEKAKEAFDEGEYDEVLSTLESTIEENADAKSLYNEAQYDGYEAKIKNVMRLSKDSQIEELLFALETTYEKDDNKRIDLEDKLIDVVDSYFEDEPALEDFEVWESVAANLKKEGVGDSASLAKSILKVLDSYGQKKLKLALEGTWIREDDSMLSGSYMNISFKGDSGVGILTKVSDNSYGFEKGDIKWKNIKVLDGTNIVFDDLHRSRSDYYDYWSDSYVTDYYHDYEEGSGTIDFDNEKINVHITSNGYEDGTDQIWVRQSTGNKDEDVKDKATEVVPANSNEYIFPNSNTEYLTDEQVSCLTKEQLRLARNEIFARHGYIFKDEELKEYFSSKSWYTGTINADAFDINSLSKIEKANVDLIKKYE